MHHSITNNLWLKIFSFVLATLIWFVIDANFHGPENRVADNPLRPDDARTFQRPIVVKTSANNRQAVHVDPTEVTVKVLGDAAIVNKLSPNEIEVYVTLLNVQNPQGSFRVEVNAPREITVQQIWPAHVYVKPVTPDDGLSQTYDAKEKNLRNGRGSGDSER